MSYPTSPAPNSIDLNEAKFLNEHQTAEDGTKYAYNRNSKMLLTWTLHYTLLTETNQATLWAWYEGVYGDYGTDTWTNPETGVAHTVRCKSMKVTEALRGGYGKRRRSMEVILEEQP